MELLTLARSLQCKTDWATHDHPYSTESNNVWNTYEGCFSLSASHALQVSDMFSHWTAHNNQSKHILWFPAFLTPAEVSLVTTGTSSNKQTVHIRDLLNLVDYASSNNVNLQYITQILYSMYHSEDMLIEIWCSHILFKLLLHQIVPLQISIVKCFHIFHTVIDIVQLTVFPASWFCLRSPFPCLQDIINKPKQTLNKNYCHF